MEYAVARRVLVHGGRGVVDVRLGDPPVEH